MAGFFISLEGIEGGGKSTQAPLLAQALRARGHEVVETCEPGGTTVGLALRRLLLEPAAPPLARATELLLMLADRAQHVQAVIAPALHAQKIVVSDRFVDSTTAYQGYGRGVELEFLARLNAFASGGYVPDLTLLLDLPVAEGVRRVGDRRGAANRADPFEAEAVEFHERVRAGFLTIASREPQRVSRVDARRAVEEVHHEILAIVLDRLSKHPPLTGRE